MGNEATIDFNRDIRPILSDKCYQCHGHDAAHREADLRLDQEVAAQADLGGYQAIAPGNPDASELVTRILSADPDEIMPPADSGKQLQEQEIIKLRRWIEQGAVWSEPWSYVSPVRHPVPEVQQSQWSGHWVDRFVLARLEQEGIKPAPDADRVTLIRRVYFDLTGLPPTPAEVDQFLEDRSPDAYVQLVERLLASPHYGQRMASYWLDLVRYADTVGYHGDQDQSISPYRDYVINAFNDNMPLDQFTHEQLAGDLLPKETTPLENVEQLIATGYNRLLQTSHEGGIQPKEYLAIYAADRVRNFSSVWLAATMGCCQCHDHKYDPYTSKDFYSMQAFFADIDEAQHFTKGGNALPTPRPPELDILSRQQRAQLTQWEKILAQLKQSNSSKGPLTNQIRQLEQQCQAIRKQTQRTMITVSIEPRPIRILPRGNWLDESGPIVEPAVPEFLRQLDVVDRRATRLDLAQWLTNPDQGVGGLTARVFVNRFWYLCLGTGIARQLDDFGGQGEPPANLALLDNLAMEFLESGWDVKAMLKLLVTSRTYRQSSFHRPGLVQRNPYNQFTARQARYRLPAEMVRDQILTVSGLLQTNFGGPSIRPYQPAGYYRNLNFPTRTYHADTDRQQWRRGVYLHWQRQFLHPMFMALDAPSREECTAQRPQSNTPLAALTLLNDPSLVEAARVFAQRILSEGGPETQQRLDFAFRLAVSHRPDESQRTLLTNLLQLRQQQFANDPPSAEKLIQTGNAPVATHLDLIELAAWTSVARAILNMNETIMRN
ncbi:MAG: PSD1 and planctomycete cytochrome C domain-containing protein [Pirellulales bacterium]